MQVGTPGFCAPLPWTPCCCLRRPGSECLWAGPQLEALGSTLGAGGHELGSMTWRRRVVLRSVCCPWPASTLSRSGKASGPPHPQWPPSGCVGPGTPAWGQVGVLPEGVLPSGVLGTPYVITVNTERRTWRQVSTAAPASCTNAALIHLGDKSFCPEQGSWKTGRTLVVQET